MFFIRSLSKANQFIKYFIIVHLTLEYLTTCCVAAQDKITYGIGEWSDDKESVTLFYKSEKKDPQIFLALVRPNELHLRIDTIKEIVNLPGNVSWPLQWLIDHTSGEVKIKLNKLKPLKWVIITANTTKKITEKDFWPGIVKENGKISEDSYFVRIQTSNNVFQHIPTGLHVALRKEEFGKLTKPYTAVPVIADAMKLTSETWRSSDELMNFLIKRYPGTGMSMYTTNPTVSDGGSTPIFISNIRGPFLTSYLENKKKVFLFAAGTGITPMISIIIWVLKYLPQTSVKLYHFNKEPKFVIWWDKLQMLDVENRRFENVNVYSSEDWIKQNNWPGLKGHVTRDIVVNALPTGEKEEVFVVMCGMPKFTFFIEDVLVGVLGYKINDNYFPYRGDRPDDIPKNLQEFLIKHPEK